jgi:hypothetical protein
MLAPIQNQKAYKELGGVLNRLGRSEGPPCAKAMANAVLFAKLDITHKLNAMIILFGILVFIYEIGEVFRFDLWGRHFFNTKNMTDPYFPSNSSVSIRVHLWLNFLIL